MSGNQNWRTPPDLMELMRAEFEFTFDLAATESCAIVGRYASGPCYRCDESAPTQQRTFCRCGHCVELSGEVIWCNPPYSGLGPWVEQFARLKASGNTVIALLQPKTDAAWFADLAALANEIRFLKGRVQFIHPDTGRRGENSNNAGSILAVIRPRRQRGDALMWVWDWRSELPTRSAQMALLGTEAAS